MLSSDDAPPVDRPNLSKDYLAGSAPEEWLPLRDESFYSDNAIDLRLNATVAAIDLKAREVALAGGEKLPFDRLLLATGAEPVSPSIPGAKPSDVLVLRSLKDCRAIIERAKTARRAVVLGASFIGLEVAASLRARNIEVHVVAPEERPMEQILGPDFGRLVQALHEEHGVVFHLQDTASAVEGKRIRLRGGTVLEADFIVAGLGVRPRLELAEAAGLKVDRGVAVDAYLETSSPGSSPPATSRAGPTALRARPFASSIGSWRNGRDTTAALNMLGRREPFDAVPFFWSQHYDVPINYVGHAETWDELAVEGDIGAKDGLARMRRAGRTLAVASVFRDPESLEAEVSLERENCARRSGLTSLHIAPAARLAYPARMDPSCAALSALTEQIRACRVCRDAPVYGPPLPHEPRPVFQVSPSARICIAGQAPGVRVHASGRPYTDPSGVRLRSWLGIGEDIFYDPKIVAVVAMGFCFPGLDAHGGDLPPRRECAELWRKQMFALLPNLELILLVGQYAQKWHLSPKVVGRV